METCISEALLKLDGCDLIYVTFDVDSMDCDLISYGTGTPVSKGFDQYEIIEILKGVLSSGKVACLEVTEINPLLDNRGNKMAEVAFEVIEGVIDEIS
ncbi:Arginase [compost metagenome]